MGSFIGRHPMPKHAAMHKLLILGSAAVGAIALANPAEAAKVVFTAPASTLFTVPNATAGTGAVNAGVSISTTGGTGGFTGVTGWTNASGASNVQTAAWRAPSTGTTSPGGSRTVDLRFNQFTLAGTCALCGSLIVPSSNGFNLGGVYPASGIALNTGSNNASTIRGGALYGQPAITFAVPGSSTPGSLSFEAISGGAYTITLETVDEVPAPLPLLGGASAFAASRRLRRRIRMSQST